MQFQIGELSKLGGQEISSDKVSNMNFSNSGSTVYRVWNEDTLKSQGIDTTNLAQKDEIYIEYDITNKKVEVASKKSYSDNGNAIHNLKDF